MSLEENKVIAKAAFDMFAGTMDLSHVEEYIATDIVDHQGWPGIDTQGAEGFRRIVTTFATAFPDAKMELLPPIAEGDLVVGHFHMAGTNTGDIMGMPATGKPIDIWGVDIVRVANGKAVEHWGYLEDGKMMMQLGMMPGGPA